MKKEAIINVPNFLTLVRVVLTFVLIYLFIFQFDVRNILFIFVFAAITDFLDGQVARRFNQVTKFGAKFDILADRFLWITTGLFILIFFPLYGVFDSYHVLQFALIMTREILCFPFALINLFRRRKILVEARWSGKVTTFLQGFAIPLVILSVYSEYFDFALIFVVVTALSGVWAARDYIKGINFFD